MTSNDDLGPGGPSDDLTDATVLGIHDPDCGHAAAPFGCPFASPSSPRQGDRIGHYVLIDRLGAGAYGEVWKAEQSEPVRRVVAVKILNAGMNSTAVVTRFRAEQQALAMMDHPGIAKIFDAGVAPSGLPYFVMQYVKGDTLVDYCDRKRLAIPQRLELFALVCDAVHHAHQKGVIHRDLKPSNVVVTTDDKGTAQPVVVDFGIAKATAEPLTADTVRSVLGRPQGTWAYMSPEQAEGLPDVDTTSDVYSLGVVLYELLCGFRPFDDDTFREASEEARKRLIREQAPTPPDEKVDRDTTGTGARSARNRRSSQRDLARILRGELGWIPLYALRKERERRYASAAALSEDVRRFLSGSPLVAAPESSSYRLRKYARQHRVPVIAGLLLLASLIAGLTGTTWAMLRASEIARNEAKARARAERVVTFVTKSLQSADPTQGGSQTLTVLEAMDLAIRDLRAGRFGEDPETAAQILATIAVVFRNNGRAPEAESFFAEALEIRRSLAPPNEALVADSLDGLGLLLRTLGRLPEAEERLAEALKIRQRVLPPDHPSLAASLNNLGLVLKDTSRVTEAETLIREALRINRQCYPGDHVETASTLGNLGNMLGELGRFDEALSMLQDATDMLRRAYAGDHPHIATLLNNRGFMLQVLGRYREAEPLLDEALAMQRQAYRGDQPAVATALLNLALVRAGLGQLTSAESLQTEANEMLRRLYSMDHPALAQSCDSLGSTKLALGRVEEAETLIIEAVEMRRRIAPAGNADLADSLNSLAQLREQTGRVFEAETLYAEALELRRRVFAGRDSKELAQSLNNLGGALFRLKREAEAEPLIAEAAEMFRRLYKSGHLRLAVTLLNLAVLRERIGKLDEAEVAATEALAVRRSIEGGETISLAFNLRFLAMLSLKQGRASDAVRFAEEAVAIAERLLPDGDTRRNEYAATLAECIRKRDASTEPK
jgi:serine/threonine protein kinase/Tfp pilus assembly protein PilF